MRFRFILSLLFISLSFSLKAAPTCTEANIKIKNSDLKKVMIKWINKKETKFRFLYGKEVVIANPFFCYQRKGFKECLGDDDSGHLIIKKDKVRIKRLTIRTPDDRHHSIKEVTSTFSLKEVPCK